MRKLWIILICFTCAYIAQGDCHWLGYSSRDTSPVLPLQSEVTTGDFIGHDPISREMHSPYAPERAAENILLNAKGGFIPRSFASDSGEEEDEEEGSISSSGQETEAMMSEMPAQEFAGEEGVDDEDLHLMSEMPEDVSIGEQAWTTEGFVGIHDGNDEGDEERAAPDVDEDEDIHLASEKHSVGDEYNEQVYTAEGFVGTHYGDDKEDRSEGSSRQKRAAPEVNDDENLHVVSEMPVEFAAGDENNGQAYTTEEYNDIQDNSDDEDDSGEGSSSWQEEAAPDDRNVVDANEPFAMPSSDIRWSGLAMAHARQRDDSVNTKKGKETTAGGDASSVQTTLLIIFITGGSLVLLLMTAFFIFAWPVRTYYAHMCERMKNQEDVESAGWYMYGDELSSIRVDPSYPSAPVPIPPPPPPQECYTPASYQSSGKTAVGYVKPYDSGVRANNQINIHFIDQSNRIKRAKILADDWQRDPRNAERRKVIKRETNQRRDSLVDSLLIAKRVIDGHAKNKQFEKKAKERRRVIKTRCSAPGSYQNQRRLSFLEELQTAQEVVVPKWDHRESVERSKMKCRAIKQQFTGKRRPSLQEEIGVARDVIVDSERRKRSLPAEVVQEMIAAQRYPGGPVNYYSQLIDKLVKEREDDVAGHGNDTHTIEDLTNDADIDALTSGLSGLLMVVGERTNLSPEERQHMIENEILWY